MTSLKSAAATPAGPREFDPEITDMASYIHNYKIDSELAVSFASSLRFILRDDKALGKLNANNETHGTSLTPLDMSSSIP